MASARSAAGTVVARQVDGMWVFSHPYSGEFFFCSSGPVYGYRRRQIRRNRIFRDRTNPFDEFDDVELYKKFRFRREDIITITAEIADDIEHVNRQGSLPTLLQVLTALRFYATGSFQDVCGEMIGIHQSTASRTITRVTEALLKQVPGWVLLPTQEEAEKTKRQFFFGGMAFQMQLEQLMAPKYGYRLLLSRNMSS